MRKSFKLSLLTRKFNDKISSMNRNYFTGEPAGNKEFIISLHWQSVLEVMYENAFLVHVKKAY